MAHKSKTGQMTWKDLAQALGYSVSYITQRRMRDDSAPDTPNLEDWRDYLEGLKESKGKGKDQEGNSAALRRTLAQAEAAEQMAEARRIENQRKRGELVERARVNDMLGRMGIAMHSLLAGILETRITTCAGYSGAQLREWGRAAHVEVCDLMQQSIDEWHRQEGNEGLGDA